RNTPNTFLEMRRHSGRSGRSGPLRPLHGPSKDSHEALLAGASTIASANLKEFQKRNHAMAGKNETTIDRSKREMTATRVVDAPRSLVFAAWTDPTHVAKWWGPNGFTNTVREMDVRPGGTWLLVMHGPDGTNYPNTWIFEEIVPPERLVLSHVTGPRFR